MRGSERLKIALDETRMLVLGAQILLGFQLRGPFQDGFEALSGTSRSLHGLALMLMTLVVGFLIAPAIFNRVLGSGRATASVNRAIGGFMIAALAPLALGMGLNMFIAIERVSGALAIPAAVATLAVALWLWFGMELRALRAKGGGPAMKTEDEYIPLAQKIDQMLTEARVILPGAQALLGFQLTVVLTQAFERLPATSKAVHAFALACVAVCTIVLMAPAVYHRMVYSGEASWELYHLGGRFMMVATLALALGLCADIYVVIAMIAQSATVGLAAAAIALAVLLGLWHVAPSVLRRLQRPQRMEPSI